MLPCGLFHFPGESLRSSKEPGAGHAYTDSHCPGEEAAASFVRHYPDATLGWPLCHPGPQSGGEEDIEDAGHPEGQH